MEYQQEPETGATGLAFAGFGEAVLPFPVLEEVPHSNSVLVLVSFSFLTTYSCCADILVEQGKLWPLPASPTRHAAVPGQAVWSSACGLCGSGGENSQSLHGFKKTLWIYSCCKGTVQCLAVLSKCLRIPCAVPRAEIFGRHAVSLSSFFSRLFDGLTALCPRAPVLGYPQPFPITGTGTCTCSARGMIGRWLLGRDKCWAGCRHYQKGLSGVQYVCCGLRRKGVPGAAAGSN